MSDYKHHNAQLDYNWLSLMVLRLDNYCPISHQKSSWMVNWRSKFYMTLLNYVWLNSPRHDHWWWRLGLGFDGCSEPLPCFRRCHAGSSSWLPTSSASLWLGALFVLSSSDNSDKGVSTVIMYINYNYQRSLVYLPMPSSTASALVVAAPLEVASSLARQAI